MSRITRAFMVAFLLAFPTAAQAEPAHGLAMHGAPALDAGFEALPYANPDAPKGGTIVYGEQTSFDSLNPYIVKGRAPWALRTHVFESLMARSWDEPFTLYGRIAETIEVPEDRSWVAFTLRPEARFSNGDPVTVDDVIFSMETLRDQGRPNFRSYYGKIARIERIGDHGVKFHLDGDDREAPLIIGLMPILSKADWAGKDFTRTTLEAPVGSGPYTVAAVDPGASLTLEKDPDWWGADLPVNRGLYNFQTVKYLFFRDGNALWEAFKTGEVHERRETDPARWAEEYDFPAMVRGEAERGEITHRRPSGMTGFVFNTRRAPFDDRRVREALTHALDFEWINKTLHYGAYERITSYFGNSPLAHEGAASGAERAVLLPFEDTLPDGTLDTPYAWPITDGTGRNRKNLRKARQILENAGWTVEEGVLRHSSGEVFEFEILLGSARYEPAAAAFAASLETLGIKTRLRLVDGAQYQERLRDYDYDMIVHTWWLSLSPGNEQRFYWGADGVEEAGSRNYMGADHPAIEASIAALLSATSKADFEKSVKALDRVLTTQLYAIPLWYSPVDRFAWRAGLARPERDALYGYRPEVWWREGAEKSEGTTE